MPYHFPISFLNLSKSREIPRKKNFLLIFCVFEINLCHSFHSSWFKLLFFSFLFSSLLPFFSSLLPYVYRTRYVFSFAAFCTFELYLGLVPRPPLPSPSLSWKSQICQLPFSSSPLSFYLLIQIYAFYMLSAIIKKDMKQSKSWSNWNPLQFMFELENVVITIQTFSLEEWTWSMTKLQTAD